MGLVQQADVRNRLLSTLAPEDFARLQPSLTRVELDLRTILFASDAPLTTAYFIESGWISMLASLESGDAAEVGIVGREGMIGLPIVFDTERSPIEAMVQGEGYALSIGAEALRAALDASPILLKLLLRYSQAFYAHLTQTAACNGRHLIGQRLARWLLTAHEKAEAARFPITHEFLSMMLGVRRAGITVAAGVLQQAGHIRYHKGYVEILDRPGLLAASCECYEAVQREFTRLLSVEALQASLGTSSAA